MSNLGCLFYMAATSAPKEISPVTCPQCLSEETRMVDDEHDVYECLKCGETFPRRPSNHQNAELDA